MAKNDSQLEDLRYLFWAESRLKLIAKHFEATEEKTSAWEIEQAMLLIKQEFSHLQKELDSLLPHFITFDHLWSIFPPDCLCVAEDSIGIQSIFRARTASIQREQDGSRKFLVQADYLEWDGITFGLVNKQFFVPQFRGRMRIDELPCIPLQFCENMEEIMKDIIKRSEEKESFCQTGFHVKDYHGERVVIDPAQMRSSHRGTVPQPRRVKRELHAWDVQALGFEVRLPQRPR